MIGDALKWYSWMHSMAQLSTWEKFARDLKLRFGPSSYINHEVSLYKLRQTTIVTAYLKEFEALSNRVKGLSNINLLNCFLLGLCEDIKHELFLLKPYSLHEAIGKAKLVEDKRATTRIVNLHSPNFRQITPTAPQLTNTSTSSTRPTYFPVKRTTLTKMAVQQNTLTGEDVESFAQITLDEPVTFPDTTTLSNLLHAFTGQFVPRTLKVTSSINDHSIVALIDGGSPHNFIQSRLPIHLGLAIQPSRHLNVTIRNEDTIGCLVLAHQ
ncbi:ty3-gypsy retrotransposon protein [Tanacetum coccineum]|uniref:Ty3-gypsy retrotransposon protein n=1 Tax=Tanacetum coccineum TaxID=301880 RepID=A0ABQ5CGL2_9ASTR